LAARRSTQTRVNVGVYTVLLMVILGLLTAVPAAPWATPQA
jgi:hypothetical protein